MPERTDTERLDWLERQGEPNALGWVCRDSDTGRGWRLHQTTRSDAMPNIRTAIDVAMATGQTEVL